MVSRLPMNRFLLPLQTFSQLPSVPIPAIRGVKITMDDGRLPCS